MSAWDDNTGVGTLGTGVRGWPRELRPRRAPALCLGLVAGLLAAALSSCSPGTPAASGPTGGARPAAPVAIVTTAPLPQRVANDVALRADVVQTSCAAVPGGWAAQGTVKNSGRHTATYKITVFFTTTQATTVDFAVVKVRVPAGATRPWTARRALTTERTLLCPMPGIAKVG